MILIQFLICDIPRERYVDWNFLGLLGLSAPFSSYRASGMWVEIWSAISLSIPSGHTARAVCGLKWFELISFLLHDRHTARAVCGLKYVAFRLDFHQTSSYRSRGMWIEIDLLPNHPYICLVIPRERYVDWNSLINALSTDGIMSYRASDMWIEVYYLYRSTL